MPIHRVLGTAYPFFQYTLKMGLSENWLVGQFRVRTGNG